MRDRPELRRKISKCISKETIANRRWRQTGRRLGVRNRAFLLQELVPCSSDRPVLLVRSDHKIQAENPKFGGKDWSCRCLNYAGERQMPGVFNLEKSLQSLTWLRLRVHHQIISGVLFFKIFLQRVPSCERAFKYGSIVEAILF